MDPEGRQSPKQGLGRIALLGSIAQIASRGLRALLGIITLGIVSRFLTPAEFGAFALIFFLILLVQLLSDFGLRMALVQKAEVTELEMSSVFWLSVAVSAGISLSVFLAAGPIAGLLGDASVAPYVRMVAPTFLISSLRGVPLAVLERGFRFGAIATAEFVAALAGTLTVIGFAVGGASVEALIFQQYAMVIVNVLMTLWYARWRPLPQFSVDALRPMMGFGTSLTMTAVLQFAAGYIDRPIIGNRLPASDLGNLTVAHQVVMTPVRTIVQNMRRVTFPVLSSVQTDTARMARAHLDSLHVLFLVLAPVCLGLSAISEPAMRLLLGPGWGPAAQIVSVFSIMTLFGSIAEANGSVLSSRGRVSFLLGWSVLSLGANVGTLLLAVDHGIMAVAWSRCILVVLFLMPLQSWFLAREIEIPQTAIAAAILRPTLAAGIMAAAVFGLDRLMATAGWSEMVRVVAAVALGGLVYAGAILVLDWSAVMTLVRRVKGMRG